MATRVKRSVVASSRAARSASAMPSSARATGASGPKRSAAGRLRAAALGDERDGARQPRHTGAQSDRGAREAEDAAERGQQERRHDRRVSSGGRGHAGRSSEQDDRRERGDLSGGQHVLRLGFARWAMRGRKGTVPSVTFVWAGEASATRPDFRAIPRAGRARAHRCSTTPCPAGGYEGQASQQRHPSLRSSW